MLPCSQLFFFSSDLFSPFSLPLSSVSSSSSRPLGPTHATAQPTPFAQANLLHIYDGKSPRSVRNSRGKTHHTMQKAKEKNHGNGTPGFQRRGEGGVFSPTTPRGPLKEPPRAPRGPLITMSGATLPRAANGARVTIAVHCPVVIFQSDQRSVASPQREHRIS